MVMTVIVLQAAGKGQWQKFTASAYSVEGKTASGSQTREGRTVAADTDILPLGTRIEVQGAGPYDGVYVVHDAGRKIRGREIDIFIDAPAEARRFGKKAVRVRVLGKPEKSLPRLSRAQ
jgi:3D (Asp-Asp-Asp) domain-containing protein